MAVAALAVMILGVAALGGADPVEVDDRGPALLTPTPGPPPFSLTVDQLEPCGPTCRDVTLTVRNEQSTAATDVGITAVIYAGQGTEGTAVWTGYEYVGTVDGGAEHQLTERVSLSLRQAAAVQNAGGFVTVQTTIEYDDRVVTFTRQRRVG